MFDFIIVLGVYIFLCTSKLKAFDNCWILRTPYSYLHHLAWPKDYVMDLFFINLRTKKPRILKLPAFSASFYAHQWDPACWETLLWYLWICQCRLLFMTMHSFLLWLRGHPSAWPWITNRVSSFITATFWISKPDLFSNPKWPTADWRLIAFWCIF